MNALSCSPAAGSAAAVARLRRRLPVATQEPHARQERVPLAAALMPSRTSPVRIEALPAWLSAVGALHTGIAATLCAGSSRDAGILLPLLRLAELKADLARWGHPDSAPTLLQLGALYRWRQAAGGGGLPAMSWFLAGSCAGASMLAASLRRQGLPEQGWRSLACADAASARRLADAALEDWAGADAAVEEATVRAAVAAFGLCERFMQESPP